MPIFAIAENKELIPLNNPLPVTLKKDNWTGSTVPFIQTVNVDKLKESDNPIVVSMLEDGATEAQQKAYVKAFGIIASGTAMTGDGQAIFKVYKKPDTDIVIGLIGV